MARYFFSLEDGRKLSDEQGEELPCDEAARAVGRQIARDLAGSNENPDDIKVVVRTAEGNVVSTAHLKEVNLL
jgi:hypothetical protein